MCNVLRREKREQVIAPARLGWSLGRIEQATGVGRETAGEYLRGAGIALRRPGGWGRHTPKPAIDPITDSQREDSKPAINLITDPEGGDSKPAIEVITDLSVRKPGCGPVTAIRDRLLHYGHVLQCRPRSWRTKTSSREESQ